MIFDRCVKWTTYFEGVRSRSDMNVFDAMKYPKKEVDSDEEVIK